MTDAFAASTTPLPLPFEPSRAERTLAALADAPEHLCLPPRARAVLAAAFGNSPYLTRLGVREPDVLSALAARGPDAAFSDVLAVVRAQDPFAGELQAMAALRRAKRRAALIVALADVAGLWTLEDVTLALSHFADEAVSAALRVLLVKEARRAELAFSNIAHLEAATGLVILAMGKYGAFELNYSSDIDLIIFYDAKEFPFRKNDEPRPAAVDLAKGLVKLLAEPTGDGYVFRVDLRLRPDAGATQIAISTDAAIDYYEGMGQNWERAALIKARPCAGDIESGNAFLKAIEPFVWRRNLDYAAIEDIHSIKRQIHAHRGHRKPAVAGHNIKLGRGGIREIEFFAQTQQLILGGRNPALRARGTIEALGALCAAGHVATNVARDLGEAYRFLRTLEHRLQMIEDEQTHTLPRSHEGLSHVACFAGFSDEAAFSQALMMHLETVQVHYERLFEKAAPLSVARGSLVFTGVEDDPETVDTLAKLGFRDPHHVARVVRDWHHGHIRATRSPRARELLTKLMPALLDALAATPAPDAAFGQFDRFLSRQAGGVQLFSLLFANPHLLERVATIAGSTPRLADHLARSPATIDVLLDPDFLGRLPSRGELDRTFTQSLAEAGGFEDTLDVVRRLVREQKFRVGMQIIEGQVPPGEAGLAFSDIADSAIEGLLSVVGKAHEAAAGRVEGGAFAVVAMGKLGGREMTAASDLDLIFVYDAPFDVELSDGEKPLAVSTYFTRLAQRLIAALTVLTGEGGLYEVDMRLRPSGNKGPVAVSLDSFRRYHRDDAWTWERLALTRARVVAGPPALGREIAQIVAQTLSSAAQKGHIRKDAREMRAKLALGFPARSRWDLKFAPGGLVDIEFIAQTLQLEEAAGKPEICRANTIAALEALTRSGALTRDDGEMLTDASRLQQSLTQVLKMAVEGVFEPKTATEGLKALLARAGGAADFPALEVRLESAQKDVRRYFGRFFGGP